jgi:GNAT superfamily N-acetyltransferase
VTTRTAVRSAVREDVPAVLGLIHALAAYEREPDAVQTTEADLHRALFPAEGTPTTFCHVAEVDGAVVGMAVWFVTFSTWTGRNGIWLEDLFVLPEHRGGGHGKALLASLAAVCLERGWPRLEWTVLDWNTPSIEFYRALGASPMDGWTTQRVTGEALETLAVLR